MVHTVSPRTGLLAVILLMVAALLGCGPGDDKGKDKKIEPAPPPKAAPAPPPPAPKKKEEPKPEPKAAVDPDGWVLLGQQQVDHQTEKERFQIRGKGGKIRELRVTVQGAPVTMEEMTVTFGNDEQVKPKLRHEFKEKSMSRAIDLPGDPRAIKYVDFVYRTSGGSGAKATVLLHGR